MTVTVTVVVGILFLVGAGLYASVGHGGASSYLAVMGLFSFAPSVMKPTALTLNIIVAAVATYKFWRAGLFSWRLFSSFAVISVPAAFIGGATSLPARGYKIVVGLVLLYAAVWMFRSAKRVSAATARRPPIAAALAAGLAIGFLS